MTQPISTGGPHGGGVAGLGMGGFGNVAMGPSGSGAVRTQAGIHAVSSFGVRHTTLGPGDGGGFKARAFLQSERVLALGRRESYYRCTHHDWKMFDFEGRMIQPGPPTSQPLLSAQPAPWYVPLRLRRPTAPYRLARVIVNSFTSLLFGHGRWPAIKNPDEQVEDYARELARAANLRSVMIRGRNLGGSVGTVGFSYRFWNGKPKVEVHNGKHLCVHEWEDQNELIPAHVSEIYTYPKDVYDEQKRRYVQKWYWFRQDWTPMADVAFQECEYENDKDPTWVIDDENTVVHNDGCAHFVWCQNLPEEDQSQIDGQPDYAEQYEVFESLDVLKSVVVRGSTLNLDPTLVLKLDPDIVQRTGIKKGSDNSLLVGLSGDAKYMELQGNSVNVGIQLIDRLRDAALESAQCVVPDPDKIGNAAHSRQGLKTIYEPMLSKADVLRVQYGRAIERIIEGLCRSAYNHTGYEPIVDDTGVPTGEEVHYTVDLPPKVRTEPELDEDGAPTGAETIFYDERTPPEPERLVDVELDWPDYFNPTADDRQKDIGTLGAAVTQRVMPQQSAVEEVAQMYGRNPRTEWERLQKEISLVAEQQAMALEGTGGEVEEDVDVDALDLEAKKQPETAAEPTPMQSVAGLAQAGDVELGVADLAKIVTVNEARASTGLGPLMRDGSLDPDGHLTVAEFAAKRAALGKAEAEVVGEHKGKEEAGIPTEAEEAAAAAQNKAVQEYAQSIGVTPEAGGGGEAEG